MQIVIDSDGDRSELEQLRLELADEIGLLPVEDIRQLTAGEAPSGTRALDIAVLGGLMVKLGPAALSAVVSVVKGWLERSSAKSVELCLDGDCIKLTGASDDEQGRLLALFEQRHGSSSSR